MNLLWVKEVIRHINISRLDANCFWWMYFPGNGKLSVAMWDDSEGHVYGHYESEFIPKEYKLPDGITVIKLSEYYAVKERYEELCSKLNICTNAGPGKYEVVYADHNGAECSKTFDIQNVDGGDEVQRKLISGLLCRNRKRLRITDSRKNLVTQFLRKLVACQFS